MIGPNLNDCWIAMENIGNDAWDDSVPFDSRIIIKVLGERWEVLLRQERFQRNYDSNSRDDEKSAKKFYETSSIAGTFSRRQEFKWQLIRGSSFTYLPTQHIWMHCKHNCCHNAISEHTPCIRSSYSQHLPSWNYESTTRNQPRFILWQGRLLNIWKMISPSQALGSQ